MHKNRINKGEIITVEGKNHAFGLYLSGRKTENFDKKTFLYKKTVVKFLINNFNGVRFELSRCRGRIAHEEMNGTREKNTENR